MVKRQSNKHLLGRDNKSHEDKISPDRNDENLFDCDEHAQSSPKLVRNMNTYTAQSEEKTSKLIQRIRSQENGDNPPEFDDLAPKSPIINIEHIDVDDIDSHDTRNFLKKRSIQQRANYSKTDVLTLQVHGK